MAPTVGCSICVLGRTDVLFTDYYMTLKTRAQLAVEFQKAVFDQTGGERVDMERALELIDYAAGQCARTPRQILEYQKKQYVILPLLQNGVEYTVNVEIGGKQRVQGSGAAYLNAVYADRYLLADISYSDYGRTTIMSAQPVRQQFNPHFRVQLEHQKPIFIANVREESDRGVRASTYGHFRFEWLRDEKRLSVTNVPYLDLMSLSIHPSGMFKVRVQATDERGNALGSWVESNAVFLRAETNENAKKGEEELYTREDQAQLEDGEGFVVNRKSVKRDFSAEPVEQTPLADVKVKDWSEFAQK